MQGEDYTMRKRIIGLLLTLVMLFSMVPAVGMTALAAETAEPRVITKVEGTSGHRGVSGYNAPSYGWPNDYKSIPEITITKLYFADGGELENPTRDVIYTKDGSAKKNWERLAADGETWEDYGMETYPKFIEGSYRYVTLLRLNLNTGYKFDADATIEIKDNYNAAGEQWYLEEDSKSFDIQWRIYSPNYTVDSGGGSNR